MKPTDGIYAKTNRRVSIPISSLLLHTPITPNLVTLITLLCSFFAGWLYAQGSYVSMVLGSVVSWAASVLDGVDGELARSRYQASDFGCWLEMLCDYLAYVFLFVGMGIGLQVATGNPLWQILGWESSLATVLSFVVIGWQRRQHSREASASDFGRAYQEKVGSKSSNRLYSFARLTGFLATRAASAYLIIAFTVLGLTKLLLVLICVGTNTALFLSAYSLRLFASRRPGSEAAPEAGEQASSTPSAERTPASQ